MHTIDNVGLHIRVITSHYRVITTSPSDNFYTVQLFPLIFPRSGIEIVILLFRNYLFMSLPGGQTLNVNTVDHWPMSRDEHSAHVATYVETVTKVMHRNGEHKS